jgi:hypothetical protein
VSSKKKPAVGAGTQEELFRATQDLYGTNRELAKLKADKAELLSLAQDEMKFLNQQLQQTVEKIKAGTLPAGSDLELRQLLLRLRLEVLSLQ